MREFKIFIIVAFIIGVMYYGVEPLAHHAMHPATAPSDYAFKDLEKYGQFDFSQGDAAKGKDVFEGACASCHTINSQADASLNMKNPKSALPAGNGAVVPPDLSNAGLIFDNNYLAHFIKDPVRASLLESKFAVACDGIKDEQKKAICDESNQGKEYYPMQAFDGILSNKEIVDVVTYLKSIAPQHLSDKEVFMEACSRCHSAVYDKNQYDSHFFATHNAQVESLLQKVKDKTNETLMDGLDANEQKFMDYLLAMAKEKEKASLTAEYLDETDEGVSNNEKINNKEFADYGGALAVLQNALIESDFHKEGVHAATQPDMIKAYLGNTPPDLSMMIRAKGRKELAAFINNPQKVGLIEIKNAIIGKLVRDRQAQDIAALPTTLSQKELLNKTKEITSRDAQYYGIKLPENTMKDAWQSDDDYTNMAKSMGVMPTGKAMPRVGLTQEAETQVINYLETIGDSKKAQRDSLGLWIIGFFILLSVLAYMWKSKIWRDLH